MNLPLSKLLKSKDQDPTCKPKLEHKVSETTNYTSLTNLSESLPQQLKNTYTHLITRDYSQDILTHLITTAQGQKGLLANHSITPSLRSKMVDWMIEVLSSYKMTE